MSQKMIFEIAISDANAALEIDDLKKRLKQVDDQLKEIGKDGKGFADLAIEASKTRAEITRLQKEQRELRKEFQNVGLAKDSLIGLRLEYGKLIQQVERLSAAERATPFGKNLIKQANAVKTEINSVEQQLGRFTGQVGNYRAGLASVAEIISGGLIGGGLVVTIGAITNAFVDGLQAVEDYGAGLDRLSSITGVTGDALEDLKNRAEDLTVIEVEGKKIVSTAQEIFEAFTLVGSARPELLQDAAALQEVTKQAIILSKASGDDLKTSVEAITTTLGQFQEPADASVRIINELAAGSKAGASEIADTTEALQEFGTTAKNSNITTGESIALIETLADRQIKAERAGIQLRNILAKLAGAEVLPKKALEQLEKAGVDINVLKDTTLPLIDRLTELGKLQGNTAALTKVFGLENLQAAQILTDGIPKYQELLGAIEGTNEAYIQAGINSDNLKTRIDNLKNEGINLLTQAFLSMEPAIEGTVEFLSDLLKLLSNGPKIVEENAEEFIALGLIMLSLNKNVIALTTSQGRQVVAQRLANAATEAGTIATRALGVVQAALPLLAVVAGLYAIAKAFEAYEDSASAAEKASKRVAEAQAEIAKESAKDFEAVRKNIAILSDDKRSKAERKQAIEELTKAYPDYLRGMDLEKANLTDLTILQDRLTASIIRSVAERKKGEATQEIASKIIEEQLKLNQLQKDRAALGSGRTTTSLTAAGRESADLAGLPISGADAAIVASTKRLEAYKAELIETEKQFDETFGIGKNELQIVIPDKGDVIDLTKIRTDSLKESTDNLSKSTDENTKKTKKAKEEINFAADSIEALRRKVKEAQETLERAPLVKNKLGVGTLNEDLLKKLRDAEKELEILESQLRRSKEREKDTAPDLSSADELRQTSTFVTTDRREAARRLAETGREVRDPGEFSDKEREAIIENNAIIVEDTEFTAKDIAEINQKLLDKKLGLSKEELDDAKRVADEKKRLNEEIEEAGYDVARQTVALVTQLRENAINRQERDQLAALDATYKKQIDAATGNVDLQEQLAQELEDKKAKIEADADEKRKKAAIREAQINTLIAITKSLTGAVFPLNLILAAGAALAGATQIAAIKKFEQGGDVQFGGRRRSGTFGGRPHSQGGTKGWFSDGTRVEVQADEDFIILNKAASAERRRLSDLNYKFGGRKFEQGGVLDFTPQIAIPAGSTNSERVVVVQTIISDDQMDTFAQIVADKTAAASGKAVGDGLDDSNRLKEREASLKQNREV